MYEHGMEPPLSVSQFLQRLLRHLGYIGVLVGVSLFVGTAGFHWIAGQPVLDALLNAAMLLGGMGPVGDLTRVSPAAKLFASAFALYAGLVFLLAAGLLLVPIFHRLLHRFHWETERERRGRGTGGTNMRGG
ncbi:MAG TPA: hypothetical protein VFT57_11695 [Gemmatimonadaceae bacterium]|nr:hypothetical protein [Gemmatimonadaceae bacterium]